MGGQCRHTTWWVVVIAAVAGAVVVLGISLSRRPGAGRPDQEPVGHVAVP
ncbi:MAG: hypothetical protein ACRDOI_09900 [Trebonia sp.]